MGPQPGAPLRSALTAAIGWLRAGYAEQAPRTGHATLIALHGPASLTARQLSCAIAALGDGPSSSADIDVAITMATNRLPTPSQRCAVSRAWRDRLLPQ
ncbi:MULTISPECIES: DUF3349 domain-containing protein [Mycolicibacterium]|uniref:DUF3349 domain-containing protein n=1 Tax=Mycolicibacterium septicum DSM 44393 TaxID=1341646 RepID=A0A7X6MT75_9MYCO|nr:MULTISPECIES: DUF3349 domain-containing protein [Mycolicibacterium]MCV7159569.1 DUF3349 domain-containing protein [Mycolicibacterium brisbanense]MCV7363508.1 DUF3349 domain-containing protein [Mycolicibacterium neworleansense]NKZ12642.1 DUF3349 domain-containing protein [Mycolicibacterium septicum DSM 44393]NOP95073.1 DUF3349 domain-containing protein [Mycolicibacterium fortuitum]